MANPANLSALSLKLTYRSGRDDLAADFFVPCLRAATFYRRAAGYFSSAGLALAARGIYLVPKLCLPRAQGIGKQSFQDLASQGELGNQNTGLSS